VTNNGLLALAAALPVLDAAGLATEGLPLVHRGPQLPAKPSAAMFQVALERLGQRSSGVRRVLVIGDSPGDAAAAKALAQSCAVPVQFIAV
jgi:phosphoglycolate phosphatase-like HAD superfamily hydrolase